MAPASAAHSPRELKPASSAATAALLLRMAFQSIGVVYGDLGTSPLYVLNSTFTAAASFPSPADVLGALSLIIYTLTLIPLLKYVFIVLRANDNGNGGTFALYSLLCRHSPTLGMMPGRATASKIRPGEDGKLQQLLERSPGTKHALLLLTLLGTCAVIGDGVLTPAISVISAVDGIQGKVPGLSNNAVALISVGILAAFFSVQRFGTDKVSFVFAPCLLLWFLFIAGIGVFNIATHDYTILRAFSPHYIYLFFRNNGTQGWISLGGIILCITGAEAMFADLGHFSVASIQVAFTTVVYPALLLAYLGQGAYLMKFPEDVAQTFYKSIPEPVYWPMFAVAVSAAIIASQAMVSAVFSIVEQSQALGCFPRVKVIHTSSKFVGQVYVPEVNWLLAVLCILITGTFKTTTLIGNAYGIAVMAVMLVTTTLLTVIMLLVWRTRLYKVVAFTGVFLVVELVYFSSTLFKFDQGGYIPVAFATILLAVMYAWHYVTAKKLEYRMRNRVEEVPYAHVQHATRLPGIAFVCAESDEGIPPIYAHFAKNLQAIHDVVVIVTFKCLPIPHVPADERISATRIGAHPSRTFRCIINYGYKESIASLGAHSGTNLTLRELDQVLTRCLEDLIKREPIEALQKMSEGHDLLQCTSNEHIEILLDDRPYPPSPLPEEGTLRLMSMPTNQQDNSTTEHNKLSNLQHDTFTTAEIAFLRQSHCTGVTYILGHVDVQASHDSSFLKRLVVNLIYNILHKACRKSSASLLATLPHTKLLQVGMIYDI